MAEEQEIFWQAVLSKDSRFDGRFVFAVKSTGVYCRPSCPSRRPRRERVVFFPVSKAAEEAGFRACYRCRPNQIASGNRKMEMVLRACRYLEVHLDEDIRLETVGRQLGLSPFYLQRTFKSVLGITPRQYAEACRTQRFKSNVRTGGSVTSALYDAGYGSSSRLYERANSELGMTPSTYGRGGREIQIVYTIRECSLGFVLVAATSRGLCAVKLGDTAASLESDLRSEFPAAEIKRSDQSLGQAVSQILDHLRGEQPHLDLPLDIRSTAFQRQVWEALRVVPYGTSLSYSDLAKAIGRPTSARAVARACATNPVALVIPCHRVVRKDRSLGGYRWGLKRKRALLDSEVARREIATTKPGK